jgi:aspartate/methionine/tyrosine aminotransferase
MCPQAQPSCPLSPWVLPGCEDDELVVAWLVKKHLVCLIPGSACGRPGHVRVAFANLQPELCAKAAGRLKAGLTELAQHGMPAVHAFLSAAGAGAGAKVQ